MCTGSATIVATVPLDQIQEFGGIFWEVEMQKLAPAHQQRPFRNSKKKSSESVDVLEASKRLRLSIGSSSGSERASAQPAFRLQTIAQSFNPAAAHEADLAIARWFYEAGIPFNAVRCAAFAQAIAAVQKTASNYPGPSYEKLRTTLLEEVGWLNMLA